MQQSLSALRELTGSVLPVAAAHGMFNALAPLLLILAPGAHPVVAGPVGIVTALLLIAAGGALWWFVPARRAPCALKVSQSRAGS